MTFPKSPDTSAMKCFSLGFLGALLLTALAVLVWPFYGNYTARAQAIEWLSLVQSIQTQIEAEAVKHSSLNGAGSHVAAPAFPSSRKPARFEISASGQILIVGNDVMLLLTPSLDSAVPQASLAPYRVAWRCVGAPMANLPSACK